MKKQEASNRGGLLGSRAALSPIRSILKISWQWGRGAIRIIALPFLFLVLTGARYLPGAVFLWEKGKAV